MEFIPNYKDKVDYIVNLIKDVNKVQILELGVREGVSTKKFLDLCRKKNGKLISIDIDDCSNVSNDENWQFIQSNDNNFELIDKYLVREFDLIYVDSYHEPQHVQKIFYHYFNFLKIGGFCIIDDISWLPYCKNEYRDNEFSENINRLIFNKILQIYNQNKDKFSLEFYFEGSGLAIIKKQKNDLKKSKIIISREFSLKNIIKKFIKTKPKK